MKIYSLLLPVLFLVIFLFALFRKVKLYDCFADGIKGALPLVRSLFPYFAAVLVLSELFEGSGLADLFEKALSPLFSLLGIPSELAGLMLVKPFSGSGSTALLTSVLEQYGADGYIGRCACVLYGSSETVFYISAVYFAGRNNKKLRKPILIALFSNFAAAVFGCFLCRFL